MSTTTTEAVACPECKSGKIGGEVGPDGTHYKCLSCEHEWDAGEPTVGSAALVLLLAHVVTPASKMHDLLLGSKTKVRSLCGAWVTKASVDGAPVCRGCFDELVRRDRNEVPDAGAA